MASDEKPRKFTSFKDLARQAGSGEEPAEQAETGPGWTLDTGDAAEVSAEAEQRLLDADEAPRERIDARPEGFGTMDGGPPPYRDEQSEEMELLASFRVRTVFPADVAEEVASLPEDPLEADFAGRVDLRGETIFTIDGEDARDYDDAISVRATDDGAIELGVHIADVAHYVRPDTALDDEALARATSVYLADQVVPMLPETLSNGLCSLVPRRPRLAYSVVMTFDADGARTAARVHKSVIESVERITYRAVQELLDGEDSEGARVIARLEPELRLLETWTRRQQALRDARGSLRMQSKERKFVFDDEHEVCAVVDAPRYFSQTLIEETALAANQAVGDLFRERGLPTIYRVHPEKDPEEIAAVARLLAEHGLRVPKKERLTGRDVARLIRAARGRPNAEALIGRIMGLIERAVYEVRDHEDVATHFGLAREAYLHFTSPIRRYPDLIVHRWLWAVESRGEEAAEELSAEELVADLNQIAAHCSVRSEVADMASRAVGDLKICQFMEPRTGERLDGKVVRVSPAGMEVLLVEPNVSAFLPTRAIGERGTVKGATLQVRRGRSARSFTEGHPVAVKLVEVDFLRLQLTLELA
ncbi:MAG: VacB/RNase II family 3'-5' exoribonuclease [Planctomycetota bacterium]|jgi:ribonuclease R|nr:VacB/RNase II family 3'-5' exoribonuclease [Planctomycetota bacterium]MDP6763965.1 VacB/RNase II family 3'-5' exoribonuclease [Planctomycetota bacterium]MDP6990127.1 VacB/RNase II family 3'-5' exoribonuclease [Planctomycetota bacterium]